MFHISHSGFGTLLSFCVSFSDKCGMKTKVANQSDYQSGSGHYLYGIWGTFAPCSNHRCSPKLH